MGWVLSCEKPKSGCRPCCQVGKATHAPTRARAGGWSCVVVDPRHAEKLQAREPGDLFGVPIPSGPVREGRGPHAGRVRRRGVGSRRSTDEAAEQRGASLGGGGGGESANRAGFRKGEKEFQKRFLPIQRALPLPRQPSNPRHGVEVTVAAKQRQPMLAA